jgi:aldose 1-epimerase
MSRTAERRKFGVLPDGTPVDLITIRRDGGLALGVIDYGCVIVSLTVPDARGRVGNVVLGYDHFEPYVESSPYFGALVGRVANRIANARFAIDGRPHQLSANEPPNHLHGGFKGFDKRMWEAEIAGTGSAVLFRRRSADGEEGYPGALDVEVTYALEGDAAFSIACDAVTDAPTHVNVSQHSYFNLSGEGDVLAHRLTIDADRYLPVDERLIPTGDVSPVADTPFDFRQPQAVGARIHERHEQLRRGGGYDHNFVLNGGGGLARAARVTDPSSGRTLEIHTTEPGLQFYSGQVVGYRGLCLEPQHYPDSPNRPEFPSTLVRPGQRYQTRTRYTFST